MRNLDLPGRSPAHATNGMAATSNYLSTMTAVRVLQEGGNAMDAAVAACAVQCVGAVDPVGDDDAGAAAAVAVTLSALASVVAGAVLASRQGGAGP